jgi:hypothetical protein
VSEKERERERKRNGVLFVQSSYFIFRGEADFDGNLGVLLQSQAKPVSFTKVSPDAEPTDDNPDAGKVRTERTYKLEGDDDDTEVQKEDLIRAYRHVHAFCLQLHIQSQNKPFSLSFPILPAF